MAELSSSTVQLLGVALFEEFLEELDDRALAKV